MTPSVEPKPVGGGGCPCGRNHPTSRSFRLCRRRADPDLGGKIYAAQSAGIAAFGPSNQHEIAYHGDCSVPLRIAANDGDRLFAAYRVRCRKCNACLRARRNYWGFAAMNVTLQSQEAGLRTWFGTLTLSGASQDEMLLRARERSSTPNAEWWEDQSCDARFLAVRKELVGEVQRFAKRLRKAGHRFKYLLVFERHKSGLPHMHFLLHEQEGKIRKKDIQAQWHLGFSNVSIVGGKSSKAAAPEAAAWYAVKYLNKAVVGRPLASQDYRPVQDDKRSRSIVRD